MVVVAGTVRDKDRNPPLAQHLATRLACAWTGACDYTPPALFRWPDGASRPPHQPRRKTCPLAVRSPAVAVVAAGAVLKLVCCHLVEEVGPAAFPLRTDPFVAGERGILACTSHEDRPSLVAPSLATSNVTT